MKGTDFIFFWHGFTLLLIGTALFLRRRGTEGRYRVPGIAVFFFLLGLSEWSAVFGTSGAPGYNLHVVRFLLFIAAFIFLFESVRTASAGTVKWLALYPVCAVIAGSAFFYGIDPAIAFQYAALPLMIPALIVLRNSNKGPVNSRGALPRSVVIIVYFYVLLWLVPAPGCQLPAVLTANAFVEYLVVSVSILRALCVSSCFAIILVKRYDYFFKAARSAGKFWLPAVCAGILVVTFIFSKLFMNIIENDMRNNISGIARGIAMGINPDRIKKLTFTAGDKNNPEFTRIREQMKYWGRYVGLRSIYSMMLKEGKLIFGPENIEDNDPLASPPGTEYMSPPRAFIEAWISGQSGVAGPYTDEYGSFVSGYAPVFDRHSGRVLMIVAVDYNVRLWDSMILQARAGSFIPFMIISLCLFFWLVLFDLRDESHTAGLTFFSRHMESVSCLTVGIIITCIISFYMNFFEKRLWAKEFYNLADSWSNIIRSIITDSRYHTEELSLYLENSEEVTWSEFKGFYSGKNILPYVSIAWYPAVKTSGRDAFESYMRSQGFYDYRIINRPGGSAAANGVYYPLAYIVPIEYGRSELGHDISGVPEIRDALDNGLLTMIKQKRYESLSSGGDMVLLNPVYKKGKCIGFVRSVINLEFMLSRVISFRNSINLGIMVDIADIADDGASRVMLTYPPPDNDGAAGIKKAEIFADYPVFYSGHTLCMKLYLSENYIKSKIRLAGPLSFALGIFLSAAVALLVAYLIFRRNSLEVEIEKRTRELRSNEERYRIVSEFTGQLVYGWDLESDQIQWSGKIEEITGFMNETFNRMGFEGWKNLVHPEDRERVLELLAEAEKSCGEFLCEYRMMRSDGSYMIVEDSGSFLNFGSDKAVAMLGVIKDITGRKSVENELRESEERFRTLHNASFGGIAIHDKGIILLCNKGLADMTGYTVAELTGMNGLLLIAPEQREFVMEKIVSGYEKSYDAMGMRKDGTMFPMEINGRNIPYKGKNMRVTEFRDITERIKIQQQLENQKDKLEESLEAQQAQTEELEAINNELVMVNRQLTESDEKFSRAFRINPAIMVISSIDDGVLVDVNEMFISVTGYARDDVIGRSSADLDFLRDNSQRNEITDQVKKNGTLKNFEIMIRTISGETRFGLLSADIIRLKDADYLLSVINDITDRKRFESAMRESEKKYRMLFDISLDAIFIAEETYFIDCNATALKMFRCSREDLIGAAPFDFSPPEQPGGGSSKELAVEKLSAVYEGKSQIFNWIHRTKDGTDFETEIYMSRLELEGRMYVMAIVRDIAERRKYETRMSHMQKMDAIGQLAGGIAHDFNNQLSGIMGYAELLSSKLQDERLKKYSDGIISVASGASELTRKLLTFSRKSGLQAVQCDIHRIINDTIELLQHSIDKRITLSFNPDAADFIVSGDPADLQNSLLNLGINARDAMNNAGVLTFSTYNITIAQDESTTRLMSVPAGEYITVCVRDTGSGMSENVKSHLFEPFFTTKSAGKGTGMGLASVYACVMNHHGSISVYSEEGKGTEFKIYLPVSPGKAEHNISEQTGIQTLPALRILVVDDETVIREILRELLKQEGHSVIEASDGNEALEIYRQSWNEIDLVILDMVMPGMNGRDTFAEMKKINSGARVIITSGFSPGGYHRRRFMDDADGYVHKPFQKSELMKVIGTVINK